MNIERTYVYPYNSDIVIHIPDKSKENEENGFYIRTRSIDENLILDIIGKGLNKPVRISQYIVCSLYVFDMNKEEFLYVSRKETMESYSNYMTNQHFLNGNICLFRVYRSHSVSSRLSQAIVGSNYYEWSITDIKGWLAINILDELNKLGRFNKSLFERAILQVIKEELCQEVESLA